MTFEGKIVRVLKVQVAHVGSSYIESTCRVGLNRVEMIRLDMMSSAMWNTCEFLKFEIS